MLYKYDDIWTEEAATRATADWIKSTCLQRDSLKCAWQTSGRSRRRSYRLKVTLDPKKNQKAKTQSRWRLFLLLHLLVGGREGGRDLKLHTPWGRQWKYVFNRCLLAVEHIYPHPPPPPTHTRTQTHTNTHMRVRKHNRWLFKTNCKSKNCI